MITRWWSVDERREGRSTNISSIRSSLSTGQKLRILHKSQYLHKISLMLYFICNEEQLLSGWRGDVLTVLISDQGGVGAMIITHLDNISTTTTWEKTRIWWGRINCSYNMVSANYSFHCFTGKRDHQAGIFIQDSENFSEISSTSWGRSWPDRNYSFWTLLRK